MKAVFLFLYSFIVFTTHAQTPDSLYADSITDITPAKSNSNKTVKIIAIAAGYTGITYIYYRYFDSDIQHFVQSNQNNTLSSIAHTAEDAGLGSSSIVITTATAITSIITKDKRLQKTAILLAGGHIINDVITNQFKITFQRHRPNTGDPYNTFDWRGGPKINLSFISSHTSNAFATATAFATVYKDKKWVPAVAYSVASLVGICRVYNNAHWTSDVLAGAAVGFASVKAMNGLYNIAAKKFTFIPQVNNGHFGITVICFL
jgi:membrane-associated phospholipid phosphatase